MSTNEISDEHISILISSFLKDEIVKLLLNKSSLTKNQFITLLIEHLSDIHFKKRITYENKALIKKRILKIGKISDKKLHGKTRGSFRRVLSQASLNVIRSIFTIFLLGYVGILDSPSLIPYVELSETIKSFIDADTTEKADPMTVSYIKNHIIALINTYAEPFFKNIQKNKQIQ